MARFEPTFRLAVHTKRKHLVLTNVRSNPYKFSRLDGLSLFTISMGLRCARELLHKSHGNFFESIFKFVPRWEVTANFHDNAVNHFDVCVSMWFPLFKY